jgi:hypothetical protein
VTTGYGKTRCPNCDAVMGVEEGCPECEHDGGDPDCECAFCHETREADAAAMEGRKP